MQRGDSSEQQVVPPSTVRIVVDPITGLPALSAGPGAPLLTSEEVEEILSCFPC
jgi:hypothetical protein